MKRIITKGVYQSWHCGQNAKAQSSVWALGSGGVQGRVSKAETSPSGLRFRGLVRGGHMVSRTEARTRSQPWMMGRCYKSEVPARSCGRQAEFHAIPAFLGLSLGSAWGRGWGCWREAMLWSAPSKKSQSESRVGPVVFAVSLSGLHSGGIFVRSIHCCVIVPGTELRT